MTATQDNPGKGTHARICYDPTHADNLPTKSSETLTRAVHPRLQYPLMKECTLNHTRDPTTIYGIFLN